MGRLAPQSHPASPGVTPGDRACALDHTRWIMLPRAGDAKCVFKQRLDRGERANALAGQLAELPDKLSDGRGRRIDRQQALLQHDERQVERAGAARLRVPLGFVLVENRLGFVSRLVHGEGDVLVNDHAGGIYTTVVGGTAQEVAR